MRIIYANICGGMIFAGQEYGQFLFSRQSLKEHIDFFKEQEPDILCLNEVHLEAEESSEMIDRISEELGLPHHHALRLSDSHLMEDKGLGLAILSRYSTNWHQRFVLRAPKIETIRPDGTKWVLHDKGVLLVEMQEGDFKFRVAVFDYFPFHHFGRRFDEEDFEDVRRELSEFFEEQEKSGPLIVTGDLNNKGVKPREWLFEMLGDESVELAVEAQSTLVGLSEQFDIIFYTKQHFLQSNTRIDRNFSDHFSISVDLFPNISD